MSKLIFESEVEWLEERSKYITASDVAAIVWYYNKERLKSKALYIDSFSSAFEIYHRFKGSYERKAPGIDLQYLYDKGKACEVPMAKYFMSKYNNAVRIEDSINFHVHDEIDYLACTPDFIIDEVHNTIDLPAEQQITKADGIGVLECKTVRPDQYWKKYIDEEPPFQYLLQLQAQMMCVGATWGFIITDNGYTTEECAYRADPGMQNIIIESVKKFKHDLDNNIEPEPTDNLIDGDIVQGLFEVTDDYTDATADEELDRMCEERNKAKSIEKENTAKYRELNNKIRIKIQGCDKTETQNHYIKLSKNNRLTVKGR